VNLREKIKGFLFFLLALAAATSARAAERHEVMEYDISWLGMTVGGMTVQEQRDGGGVVTRSIRVRSRPWVATLYRVDTTVRCVIEPTPDGPRHTVGKVVAEGGFTQDDTLTLWPATGVCIWSNAIAQSCTTSSVPVNTQDVVSFFFDLRDTLTRQTASTSADYRLVMDGTAHALEIKRGATKKISTPFGKVEAADVRAASKSPTLFSRNKPKGIWVATACPAVLAVDVGIAVGTVHVTLKSWKVDGEAVAFPNNK
jgi:hypothetical protein